MAWGYHCPVCGRVDCGALSGLRWSYAPVRPLRFGRVRDDQWLIEWRLGPLIFWRYRKWSKICAQEHLKEEGGGR